MKLQELADKYNKSVEALLEEFPSLLPSNLYVNQLKDSELGLKDDEYLVHKKVPEDVIASIAETLSQKEVQPRGEVEQAKLSEKHLILEPYYYKKKDKLLNEIMKFNQVDNLLFEGVFKRVEDSSFGFMHEVNSVSGKILKYPILNEPIRDIFYYIEEHDLVEGLKYTFEVKISSESERQKKNNPFLLRVKGGIQMRKHALLNQKIIKNKEELKKSEEELKAYKSTAFEKADQEIAAYRVQVDEQKIALQAVQEEVKDVKQQITQAKSDENNIMQSIYLLKQEKEQMENTITFLRQKIELCKNLEFLTEEDADKYVLNLEASEAFEAPDDMLSFHDDLDGDFRKLVTHVLHYLNREKGLVYTRFQIENFLTLLRTNDLIVLSGLSGSGKTQIVKSFAEALGGVAKIIPVKPNWTSSDDLLGYYNPIQSSFLPTPFTEAISEAKQNPSRLYLICIDEMNLARVEYYFADFLSKLEERDKQPEVELYAQHEEELFLSEFKTLFALLESSIKANEINSWQDFLENDDIRNRFFELLGNTETESVLQIHAKMKRRLVDILKFPSTLTIPENVRFIGAINVDETTHYFSPKILDRVHIMKFENPLLFDTLVSAELEKEEYDDLPLSPVYVPPKALGKREAYPSLEHPNAALLVEQLKEINKEFLLPPAIDFGVRSIRQSVNYALLLQEVREVAEEVALNSIVLQKILPRFLFELDGKKDSLNGLYRYIDEKTEGSKALGIFERGFSSLHYLKEMGKNKNFVNFWNISAIEEITAEN